MKANHVPMSGRWLRSRRAAEALRPVRRRRSWTGDVFLMITVMVLALPTVVRAQASGTDPAITQSVTPSGESGDTEAPMTSGEALIRKLIAGGWTMFALLLASIVGVSVVIERSMRLRRNVIAPLEFAEQADRRWRAGEFEILQQEAKANHSTLGRIVAALVRHRSSDHDSLNTIAGDIASRDLRRHLQRAYPLLVVATISPLLGLLGTVIGMVGAFSTIEALGELANPAAFGGDISKALITTGAGLSVAVPALTCYHLFKSRTLALGVELEEIASELIVEWFIASEPESSDAG